MPTLFLAWVAFTITIYTIIFLSCVISKKISYLEKQLTCKHNFKFVNHDFQDRCYVYKCKDCGLEIYIGEDQ